MRLPIVSATIPVGTSKMTMPAVKKAFAVNASTLFSPASSRKIVLIPQISEAASVFPSMSVRYVRWIDRGVGISTEGSDPAEPVNSSALVSGLERGRQRRGGVRGPIDQRRGGDAEDDGGRRADEGRAEDEDAAAGALGGRGVGVGRA